MQLKLAFVAASLTTLAGATDFPPPSDCPVGPIQCCATVEDVAQAASSSTTLEVLLVTPLALTLVAAILKLCAAQAPQLLRVSSPSAVLPSLSESECNGVAPQELNGVN
ncbi:hypothetical protein BDP27DRAFT_1425719 [Rhodocollybia butyracea]|uniref:Hydrophobin n=1 Tax=Rhodocollybia butyracea TaxID=206335 RepID=A0A9P5PJZ4_9AGAR|nr:hypothetical protein BDP27DRAFT_1425719 [Rhodocollybia butyracea]